MLSFMRCKKIICKSKVNVKVVSLQNHLTQGLSYLANFSICLSICEFLKKKGTLLFRCFGPLNISKHPFSYFKIKSLKTIFVWNHLQGIHNPQNNFLCSCGCFTSLQNVLFCTRETLLELLEDLSFANLQTLEHFTKWPSLNGLWIKYMYC